MDQVLAAALRRKPRAAEALAGAAAAARGDGDAAACRQRPEAPALPAAAAGGGRHVDGAAWSIATTTPPSASPRTPARPTSRRPSVGLPASTIPTSTRVTPRPSGGSRRSARPTRSSPTRRSARPTTSSVPTGRPTSAPVRAAGDPFAGFAGRGRRATGPGGIRFEFRGDAEDLAGFSDFFRTFFAGGASAAAAGRGQVGARVPGRRTGHARPSSDAVRLRAALRRAGRRQWCRPRLLRLRHGQRARYAAPGARARRPMPSPRRPSASRRSWPAPSATSRSAASASRSRSRRASATGQRIRLSGKAEGGGHVYITVHVAPHPVFTRDGADLGHGAAADPR